MIDFDAYRNENNPQKQSYESEKQFEYRFKKHVIQEEISELAHTVRMKGEVTEENFLKLLDIVESMND
jgi:hypothetical protein